MYATFVCFVMLRAGPEGRCLSAVWLGPPYLLSIMGLSYFNILSSVPPNAHTGVIFTTHHQWLPRKEGCLLSQPQKTGCARPQSIELSKYIVRWARL
jgi:hypothetical protein